MKVSIIIPTLNESDSVQQCLDCARGNRPDEMIVVDGGSDDHTPEIARRLGCQVLRSARGRAIQQNLGASQATGDVLLFLHADCFLPPEGLAQIRRVLRNRRVAAGAFEHRIAADGLIYRLIERGNSLRARVLRMAYGDQGLFVRRSIFHQLGGFPNVALMEDLLFVRKLRRLTPLLILPGPLTVSARRWRKHGPLKQTARNWLLLTCESMGVSPDRLVRHYDPHNARLDRPPQPQPGHSSPPGLRTYGTESELL